jgi:four helix bundle protein
MPIIKSFRDLTVWQQGMQLVEDIYELSRLLPPDERFGMTMQMRRAAISVPSNVAEGFRRWRPQAYCNHVSIALGSQGELETLIELSIRLKYVTAARASAVMHRIEEVGKMLSGLLGSLEDPTEAAASAIAPTA